MIEERERQPRIRVTRLAFPQHRDRSFPIASAALTLDVATV
jgi:hypothetical protein